MRQDVPHDIDHPRPEDHGEHRGKDAAYQGHRQLDGQLGRGFFRAHHSFVSHFVRLNRECLGQVRAQRLGLNEQRHEITHVGDGGSLS